MNALKLGMVTAMIAYSMACLTPANAPRKPIKERYYFTFDDAIKYHDLIMALYQQLSLDLPSRHQDHYLASVIVEDVQYVIMGKYADWKWFFSVRWDYLLNVCPVVISVN